jgi:hypothetical protein
MHADYRTFYLKSCYQMSTSRRRYCFYYPYLRGAVMRQALHRGMFGT